MINSKNDRFSSSPLPYEKPIIPNITTKEVKIAELPYRISYVPGELFSVIFFSPENFNSNIGKIVDEIKTNILDEIISDKSIHKFFHSIIIEILDNINRHSPRTDDGGSWLNNPTFSFEKKQSEYVISATNIGSQEDLDRLNQFIEKFNNSSYDSIKNDYKNQFINGKVSEKGGAGLGLLTIAKLLKKHLKKEPYPFMSLSSDVFVNPNVNPQKDENRTNHLVNISVNFHLPFFEQANIKNDQNDNEETFLQQIA